MSDHTCHAGCPCLIGDTPAPDFIQVGAVGRPPAHYSTPSGMQPFDVIDAFKLDFYEASVLKYLVRWRGKGGVNDLRKAQHYLEEIIERNGGGCHR